MYLLVYWYKAGWGERQMQKGRGWATRRTNREVEGRVYGRCQTQQDSFVPLSSAHLPPTPPPPAWIRFSKQWCRGHLDLWVIEGEWAALSSTSAKNTSHAVTVLQVGGKWLFPSMSKPKTITSAVTFYLGAAQTTFPRNDNRKDRKETSQPIPSALLQMALSEFRLRFYNVART